jgi:hypothetical protein
LRRSSQIRSFARQQPPDAERERSERPPMGAAVVTRKAIHGLRCQKKYPNKIKLMI